MPMRLDDFPSPVFECSRTCRRTLCLAGRLTLRRSLRISAWRLPSRHPHIHISGGGRIGQLTRRRAPCGQSCLQPTRGFALTLPGRRTSTPRLGRLVSGVFMPMYRTVYRDPSRSTSIVSPSMTLTTVAVSEREGPLPPEKSGENVGASRDNTRNPMNKMMIHVYHL